ncbi:transmembrane protein 176B-like [Gastrophryne carolinensis]
MGAISTVKTENGKVSCDTSEGTVINININQRSALDCMLDTIKTFRKSKKDGGDKKPTRETSSAIPLGIGVSLISVGFLSVALAVIIAVVRPSLEMFYSGTHFWVGFPFIVSGVLNIVAYRYPKPFWVVVAFISLVNCLCVSITGVVFAVNDINRFRWMNDMASRCDALYKSGRNSDRYYFRTEPPRYYESYNSYTYELNKCKAAMTQYQNMLLGVLIMSLLMMIWGICASAITLGYRLKVVFTACTACEIPEEEDKVEKDEPLLSPNPANEVFIA